MSAAVCVDVCAVNPLVVVVEDEFLIRLNTAEAFRAANFRVLEAKTAAEAMRFIEAGEQPDALFTDVHMPGGETGLWLAEQYEAAFPGVVVVVTSGHLDPASLDAQRRRFVTKPYEVDRVVEMIRDECRARRP